MSNDPTDEQLLTDSTLDEIERLPTEHVFDESQEANWLASYVGPLVRELRRARQSRLSEEERRAVIGLRRWVSHERQGINDEDEAPALAVLDRLLAQPAAPVEPPCTDKGLSADELAEALADAERTIADLQARSGLRYSQTEAFAHRWANEMRDYGAGKVGVSLGHWAGNDRYSFVRSLLLAARREVDEAAPVEPSPAPDAVDAFIDGHAARVAALAGFDLDDYDDEQRDFWASQVHDVLNKLVGSSDPEGDGRHVEDGRQGYRRVDGYNEGFDQGREVGRGEAARGEAAPARTATAEQVEQWAHAVVSFADDCVQGRDGPFATQVVESILRDLGIRVADQPAPREPAPLTVTAANLHSLHGLAEDMVAASSFDGHETLASRATKLVDDVLHYLRIEAQP